MCAIIRTIVGCIASIYRDRVSFFLPFCSSGLMLCNHPSLWYRRRRITLPFQRTGPAGSRCFLQRRARWRTEERHRRATSLTHRINQVHLECFSVPERASFSLSRGSDYPTMPPSLRVERRDTMREAIRYRERERDRFLSKDLSRVECMYLRPTKSVSRAICALRVKLDAFRHIPCAVISRESAASCQCKFAR